MWEGVGSSVTNFKTTKKLVDDFDCNGPRPPVLGSDNGSVEMTEGYTHFSTNYREPAPSIPQSSSAAMTIQSPMPSPVQVTNSAAAGASMPMVSSSSTSSSSAASTPAYLRWAERLENLLGDREGLALFKRYVEQEGGGSQHRLKFLLACDGLAEERVPEKIADIVDAICHFAKRTKILSKETRAQIKALRDDNTGRRTQFLEHQYRVVQSQLAETAFVNFIKSEIYLDHVWRMSSGIGAADGGGAGASGDLSAHGLAEASGSGIMAGHHQIARLGQASPMLITKSAVAANTMAIGTALGSEDLTRSLTLPTLHEYSELVCDNIVSLSVSQFGGNNINSVNININNNSIIRSSSSKASGGALVGRSSAASNVITMGASSLKSLSLASTGAAGAAAPLLSPTATTTTTTTTGSVEPPMRLTKDSLLLTAKERLEIRPPGAHAYYNNNYESYNTVSLQDSERQSYSSGQTDSERASTTMSNDGRPKMPRQKQSSSLESKMRQNSLMNKETNKTSIIPRTNRVPANKLIPQNPDELFAALIPKLAALKLKQDNDDEWARKMPESTVCHSELRDAIREKLPMEDMADDQSILDMHVKRVWKDLTPNRSPGSASPGPVTAVSRRRMPEPHLQLNYIPDGGASSSSVSSVGPSMGGSVHHHQLQQQQQQQLQAMRHSRSMPEPSPSSSRKPMANKWPTMQTDSGINQFSGDALMKKEQSSRKYTPIGSSTTDVQMEEGRRRLPEDESKTIYSSRRYATMGHHKSAPPPPVPGGECITVVISFWDEEFPYRTKIPGKQPTLKQFKEYLPRKGTFRYFFKTLCEYLDNSVIQEEIACDTDILPLYEGKVMALVKPTE